MDDGYFDKYGRGQTLILCTENFTKEECVQLIAVLNKIGIIATLKRRNVVKDTYRVRVSKKSMPSVRTMVSPYMHPSQMYKLGV